MIKRIFASLLSAGALCLPGLALATAQAPAQEGEASFLSYLFCAVLVVAVIGTVVIRARHIQEQYRRGMEAQQQAQEAAGQDE